jgi:MoxR-like ATPase
MVEELHKVIVGQNDVIDQILAAIFTGGHCLLVGVPGLAKTLALKTLAALVDAKFNRIQFTPDMLPADIVGTEIYDPREARFRVKHGPVFANFILADEINRATPKTQSALLETMQEKRVTVANTTHQIGNPFFVLATQNPIENDGTYPLPEAQLDRFFFKLSVQLPSHDNFVQILERTGGNTQPEIKAVANGDDIIEMGRVLREIPIDKAVQDFLVRVVRATHPDNSDAPEPVRTYVRHGASPRAAQAILAASRARALLDGRYHVAKEDIELSAIPAMRHRLILSFEGEAEGVLADEVIGAAIKSAYQA